MLRLGLDHASPCCDLAPTKFPAMLRRAARQVLGWTGRCELSVRQLHDPPPAGVMRLLTPLSASIE